MEKHHHLQQTLENYFKDYGYDLYEPPQEGLEMDEKIAQICFDEYTRVMNQHGFINLKTPAPTPVPPTPVQSPGSRQITESESFAGIEVLKWITKNHGWDATTVTQLKLGIYTEDFFNELDKIPVKYPPDYKTSKIGRLGIFILMYPEGITKMTDGGKVYDFGGLQP
ncbi:hypothetical protein [Chitinophaga eiseniae]|uniref:Uncharacterized protein n=1 Tax=Chitinophaga eiseniae TaxID=634771 RepID=A0A847SWD7_9BACT|nr:hypothetical protein [Chitinophaga eiseniae]NLR82509.1 hypothetical protein [Chitinophaga eiseniae]